MDLVEEKSGIQKMFYELAQNVASGIGLGIYDLEYLPGQSLMRLFIFNLKTGTATIDDCVEMDKALTPFFESEKWMPSELTLEVSSPGIYRKLRTKEHFDRAIGERISITGSFKLSPLSSPGLPKKLNGQKKVLGTLMSVSENGLKI